MIFLVMGVSGSGKTTIGRLLAEKLALPFYDADDFHPAENVSKMSRGIPLTDADRQQWLEQMATDIQRWKSEGGAVLACSALKEQYRKILEPTVETDIIWVYLEGSRQLIEERIGARNNHFMPPTLLDSQFEALEEPAYGIHVNISSPPPELVEQILEKLENMTPLSEFGIIGLGVMGKSLALNLAGKGVNLSIYNRHVTDVEENIAKNIIAQSPDLTNVAGFDDLEEFIQSLERPRKILIMIAAGAVDYQIDSLIPLLEEGDVLIDGGNSFYKDTARRTKRLAEKGIHFVGVGISGGEEGALKGPSIMPGGPKQGYEHIAGYLEKIAAQDRNGKACTTYVGPEGSGHFIKMVHNGIEYAEMQVLAESYYLMRFMLGLPAEKVAGIFSEWHADGLGSYLLEITINILRRKEEGELLLDKILDQAEQKGTGGWSVGAALEHVVPYGPLTEAVMARALSAMKKRRVEAAKLYGHELHQKSDDAARFVDQLKGAYQASRIINHEIGFNLMQQVSDQHNWDLNMSEIARIWTNGCIIRSELMEELEEVFKTEKSILTAASIVSYMQECQQDFASTIGQGLLHGIALPVMSSALNYYLGYITADSPANLIQAQRDYFGAHTYRRIDKPEDEYFHTIW